MYLGDVTHQSIRLESSKGLQSLGVLQLWGLSYLWRAVECSFAECG